jgi:hypothetical protein
VEYDGVLVPLLATAHHFPNDFPPFKIQEGQEVLDQTHTADMANGPEGAKWTATETKEW